MSNSPNRSYATIKPTDLSRIFHLAQDCLADMLARNETGRYYDADGVLLACLCQGAAQHFLFRDRGVQDWDVVFFFRTNPRWKFPPRWRGKRDFGPSRFGRNSEDGPEYLGRRIDVMARDITISTGQGEEQAIKAYLRARRTPSARFWAERPLIKLANDDSRGEVIWRGKGAMPPLP